MIITFPYFFIIFLFPDHFPTCWFPKIGVLPNHPYFSRVFHHLFFLISPFMETPISSRMRIQWEYRITIWDEKSSTIWDYTIYMFPYLMVIWWRFTHDFPPKSPSKVAAESLAEVALLRAQRHAREAKNCRFCQKNLWKLGFLCGMYGICIAYMVCVYIKYVCVYIYIYIDR